MTRWLVGDFETASACDLKIAGAWRYAQDPTTEIFCFNFQFNAEGEVYRWRPNVQDEADRVLREAVADPEVLFIAHNCGFEKAIWRSIMMPEFGFMDIPNKRWHDTMAVAAMKAMPLDLDMLTRVLGLSATKDAEGSNFTKKLSRPRRDGSLDRSPESLDRVYTYCDDDVLAQTEAHLTLGWLPPDERNTWLLDQRINERGVKLDMDYVRAAQSIVDQATVPLAREFNELTDGLKFTQTVKLRQWCTANGAELPNLQKETLDRVLGLAEDDGDDDSDFDPGAFYMDLPDNVRRALYIRQLIGSASVKKLVRMRGCVSLVDGRARGLLQYHGAGPGRWTGRLFQPQNFPRGTIKLGDEAPDPEVTVAAIMSGDAEFVQEMLGPPVEVVVQGLRHAIVAEDDRELLSGDFSGIQARVVLALAGQYDKVDLMASGADVYLNMAEQIYKPATPFNKHANMKERQVGKNSVLGLGFQMGWPKFKFKYAPNEADEFCQGVVKTYRTEWAPQVPKLWYALERAARETVWTGNPHEAYGVEYKMEGQWLTARVPTGGKIWYFNPQKVRKEMPWSTDEDPDVRPAWTYQVKKMGVWRTIDAYGGLLTENVVMRIECDLMIEAMFRCEQNGLPIVMTVHDEIVAEPLTGSADEVMLKQLMAASDKAKELRIPIQVDTWHGPRYKK